MELIYSAEPNATLNQSIAVDYETIVWTDRYRDFGDFTMTIKETPYLLEDLRTIKFLLCSVSRHVMYIETIEPLAQLNGPNLLKVSGRSLESILKYRYPRLDKFPGRDDPDYPFKPDPTHWVTGRPGQIPWIVVEQICKPSGNSVPTDGLPNLIMGSYYSSGTSQRVDLVRGEPIDVLINAFARDYDFGYEFVRNDTDTGIVFNTFKGVNRTNKDSANYTLFSPEIDTLVNPKTYQSIAGWVNHISMRIFPSLLDVNGTGTLGYTPSGWRKRSRALTDIDIRDTSGGRARAWQEMAKLENRYQNLVDGEVPADIWAGSGAKLGDIVHVGDSYNNVVQSSIEEVIHVKDSRGYRVYPTFEQVD